MIDTDEDDLICDFAETYHIYDYRRMPLHYVAVLACGLRDNSRIKMKMAEQEYTAEFLINAAMLDHLSFLSWTKTKDAQYGKNKPKSVVSRLLGNEEKKDDIVTFETAEEFEEMRQRIIRSK